MKPGIYSGLTHGDLPSGLSPSGAKTIALHTPAEYHWQQQHPRTPSRAMVIGTLLHARVLQGKTLYSLKAEGRSKDALAENAAIEAAGLVPVTAAELEAIDGMASAVMGHHQAFELLCQKGESEQAVIWKETRTGVLCRGFIDWLTPDAIVDLKSTRDASPDGFGRQAANLGYDIAEHMYHDAILTLTGKDLPFYHIAVESHAPYLVAVHEFPPIAQQHGAAMAEKALGLYKECTESGIWPGYPDREYVETLWPYWADADLDLGDVELKL